MRVAISIISSIFAAILGFAIPASLVMYFRYKFYPSLAEFDIAGLVFAFLAGILGAILSVVLMFKWTKRNKA